MKKKLLSLIMALAIPCIIFAMLSTSRAVVEVRNSAASNGWIGFVFTPHGGNPQKIFVEVKKGWSSLRVARAIASKLTTSMPREYRATSRSHGYINCVDVEKDMMRYANFSLRCTGSTVEGLTVYVDAD